MANSHFNVFWHILIISKLHSVGGYECISMLDWCSLYYWLRMNEVGLMQGGNHLLTKKWLVEKLVVDTAWTIFLCSVIHSVCCWFLHNPYTLVIFLNICSSPMILGELKQLLTPNHTCTLAIFPSTWWKWRLLDIYGTQKKTTQNLQ